MAFLRLGIAPLGLFLGLLSALAACSGEPGAGVPGARQGRQGPAPRWVVQVAPGLRAPVEVAGTRVPPGGQAAVFAPPEEGPEAEAGVQVLGSLAGQPMRVVGGMLQVGEVGRGPLPEGATLRLAPEGVFVDGEFRGPLPLP